MSLGLGGLVRPAALVLLVALLYVGGVGAPLVVAYAAEPFTVVGVPVDATADSASTARVSALAQGQRDAIQSLLQRMTLISDWPRLPKVDDPALLDLVQGFEVNDERTSATRYIAKLTVVFKREQIRALLRSSGVPFTDTLARPTLVLPIVRAGGLPVLFQGANPWRDAWAKVDASDALAPLVQPKGDDSDQNAISAEQALSGDLGRLDPLARRYGAGSVLVADANPGATAVQVTLTRYGAGLPQTIVESYSGTPTPDLMVQAVQSIVTKFEEEWKRQTILRSDTKVTLDVSVPLTGVQDWLDVRKRLDRANEVQSVEIRSLTRSDAELTLSYYGDPARLVLALAQVELVLRQRDNGWDLGLAGRPRTPVTAPAAQ
ncbi:MAG TPA: DUF2066 domain-containing protein [Candidatus Cybelea sp.]|nr:DUF2066 domain-containing protein [Candidatus Cybelea sp.]